MTHSCAPVRRLDAFIKQTHRRVQKQQWIAEAAVGTADHRSAVRLWLLFSDILFELHQTRAVLEKVDVLEKVEGAPLF